MSTSRQYFGTDGVRSRVNQGSLTPSNVLKLAIAAGLHFKNGTHRHTVVIGKDTRLSGYMIENALTAGFTSVGMNVILVGPLPTPAISMLTKSLRADLGVMITASHNPYHDNGIKFFGPDGYKLADKVEKKIESLITEAPDEHLAEPHDMGKARRLEDALGRYIEFVKSSFPRSLRLDGLKIVVDCANGAAYKSAPAILWELGATVVSIGVNPDGSNINKDCGAMHPQELSHKVIEEEADIGIALDGDADRLIVVDETGRIVDGDQILACIATHWQKEKLIKASHITATVMSNYGLELYLKSLNLGLHRTAVGDRYVCEHMRTNHCNIGGEQSGHVILSDYSATGDGIMAALQVLSAMVKNKKTASEITSLYTPIPQILKNVRFKKNPLEAPTPRLSQQIQSVETALNGHGRLLIRKSGTEPLIRLMAEGPDHNQLVQLVDSIIQTMEADGFLDTTSA